MSLPYRRLGPACLVLTAALVASSARAQTRLQRSLGPLRLGMTLNQFVATRLASTEDLPDECLPTETHRTIALRAASSVADGLAAFGYIPDSLAGTSLDLTFYHGRLAAMEFRAPVSGLDSVVSLFVAQLGYWHMATLRPFHVGEVVWSDSLSDLVLPFSTAPRPQTFSESLQPDTSVSWIRLQDRALAQAMDSAYSHHLERPC